MCARRTHRASVVAGAIRESLSALTQTCCGRAASPHASSGGIIVAAQTSSTRLLGDG